MSSPAMDVRRASRTSSSLASTISKFRSVKVSPYDPSAPGNSLQRWLRPFILSLCVLGLAHQRNLHAPRSIANNACFAYATIVNLLLWCNCLRQLTLFQDLEFTIDWVFIAKLTVIAYNVHCALSATIVYVTFTHKSYLRAYLEQWRVDFEAAYSDISLYEKALKRDVIVVTVACWALFIGTTLATFYAFLFTSLYDMSLVPFSPDHPHARLIKTGIFLIFTIRTSAAGVWAHGVVVLISLQVSRMCDFHRDAFSANIDNTGRFTGDLEEFRLKHNALGRLISTADRFMAMHNSETFVLMIALVCLVMYGLIYYPETRSDAVVTLMSLWYVVTFTASLAVVCVAAAYVNAKAHGLYHTLHGLSLQGQDVTHIAQVTVFLNRLSAQPIGFSALKMFVIDRPTILTILGMLLSYVIVMLQFKPDSTIALPTPSPTTNPITNTTL